MSVVLEMMFPPKREACRLYVKGLIELFDLGTAAALDSPSKLQNLKWLDEFTKSEIIQMGFSVGSSLRDGQSAELIRHQEKNYVHDKFNDDLNDWFFGENSRRGKAPAKGALFDIDNGNLGTVTQQMSEFVNVKAFCAGMGIANQRRDSIPAFLEILEENADEWVE